MGRVPCCSDTSHWIRSDVPDFQGAMSMIALIENGKVYNQMTLGKRLEEFGEVLIVDKEDGFGLDFVEKAKRGFRSTILHIIIIIIIINHIFKVG